MGKMYLVTPEPQAWESKIKFSPDEFFWDDVSVSKKITTSYKLKIATLRKKLGIDYFHYSSPIVSRKFRDFCDEKDVNAQFVPLEISFNSVGINDEYFFMLLNDFVSIVDIDKSKVQIAKKRGSDIDLYEPNFPNIPVLERIDLLVLKNVPTPNFFMAPEVGGRVCTEDFKLGTEQCRMVGLRFDELSENFTYDPFQFLN